MYTKQLHVGPAGHWGCIITLLSSHEKCIRQSKEAVRDGNGRAVLVVIASKVMTGDQREGGGGGHYALTHTAST